MQTGESELANNDLYLTVDYKERINFTNLKAIKTMASVDEQGNLHPDTPMPSNAKRVDLIVLFPDDDEREIDRLTSGANNPAFDFLNDPAEDIYTANDGRRLRK